MMQAIIDRYVVLVSYLRGGLSDAAHTDFGQVHYGDPATGRLLALVVIIAIALSALRRTLWPRPHFRLHSGHVIDPAHVRRWWMRVVHAVPKLVLCAAVALMIVAAADPFLPSTEEFAGSTDSRLRV